MSDDFERTKLSVIYAEDEFVFREITVPAIKRARISEEHLYIAEDGAEALEYLAKIQDSPHLPLLMILDVRMPNMDGIQCAQKVQEMVRAQSLRRVPYMVCCSAGVREVSFKDEQGVFQIVLPKPFGNKEVELCIKALAEWWAQQAPCKAASTSADAAGGTPKPASVDVKCLDMVLADDEPICRMAVCASLTQVGVQEDCLHEVEDEDELVAEIQDIQARKPDAPILLFVGSSGWLRELIQKCPLGGKRKLYSVCTSVDSDRVQASLSTFTPEASDVSFNAFLPRQFTQANIVKVLDECQSWLGES
uniref:Response regulatory domain-containing protein n=1 Tax=Alexandrium catenella TaxID=2925 RepID=A0A7S1M615_ALECA|mmetsp:Transcript_2053/g.5497  ORF Transcript_2053/g.5497 Transcript_2053/m.5497 type:complete len:306 (+) Transcript_2053:68-985(+)